MLRCEKYDQFVASRHMLSSLVQERTNSCSETSSTWMDLFWNVPHSKFSASQDDVYLPNVDSWRLIADDGHSCDEGILAAYLTGKYHSANDHPDILHIDHVVKTKSSLKYLNSDGIHRIIEALTVVYLEQKREGGSDALESSLDLDRALGAAAVLGELKADATVVLATILHDVVSRNAQNVGLIKAIESRFGVEVVRLCRQYGPLPHFDAINAKRALHTYSDLQAENQLQMLVVFAEDYRVLYMRLAERTHFMRMLRRSQLSEEQQRLAAQEALSVYAPLAHKMHLMKLRGDLEDLAFRVLQPDMFQLMRYTQAAAGKAYYDAISRIHELVHSDPHLRSQRAAVRITHRIKGKYQIYQKMLRKGLQRPTQGRDSLGMRLIVDVQPLQRPARKEPELEEERLQRSTALCYYIVERLRCMQGWEPASSQSPAETGKGLEKKDQNCSSKTSQSNGTGIGFKDYIRGVKENGYRSLHQYLRCRSAQCATVEVQVRTREMHIQAELGEAAHWCYKDQQHRPALAQSRTYKLAWRSPQQMRARTSAELFRMAKQQLRASRVFVYLEDNATVLNLARGSTALDAAFAIHTVLGLTTQSIRVNNASVELSRELATGDVVSVSSSRGGSSANCANNSITYNAGVNNSINYNAGGKCVVTESTPSSSPPLDVDDDSFAVHPEKLLQVRSRYARGALRRYFRDHNKNMLVCIGLVKLLMALVLNTDAGRRAGLVELDAQQQLEKLVAARTGLVTTYAFLCALGYASAPESERLLCSLLLAPAAQLTLLPYDTALVWVRTQAQSRLRSPAGWASQSVLHFLVLPLLRNVLPGAGDRCDDDSSDYPLPVGAAPSDNLDVDVAISAQNVSPQQPLRNIEICWNRLVGAASLNSDPNVDSVAGGWPSVAARDDGNVTVTDIELHGTLAVEVEQYRNMERKRKQMGEMGVLI